MTCTVSTEFFSVSFSTYIGIALSASSRFLMSLSLFLLFCTGVSSFLSTRFLMPLIFFFCTGIFDGDCSSKTSLGTDDLVKGFLPLVVAAGGEEGKCSLFPFLDVVLVEEGTCSNPGGGGGEKYLYGEGQASSSVPVTYLMTSKT
jgi:hypothetical protein